MKKEIETIRSLLKYINKGFGEWKCQEINLDCPKCKAEILRSYLFWLLDIYEEKD